MDIKNKNFEESRKKKKKIVIIYDFFSEHGGVEWIMLFQAKILKKAGYDVSFAFAYMNEELKNKLLKGFKVIEYSKMPIKNETIQICSSIIKDNVIKKFKNADLIICHSFPASYLALKIKKKYGVPYILHLHHPPQFLYTADLDWAKNSFKRKFSFTIGKILNYPLKKFDFYCVKNADDYIAECESVNRVLKQTYGINGKVIFPTMSPDFKIGDYKLNELAKYGIKKDYILGIGRLIKQKRFDFLVDAFSKLKNKKNLQLVLAGNDKGPVRKELEDLAAKKGVKITFTGPIDLSELVKIYNLAKVTVLTCPKEWFGIVQYTYE